MKKYLSVLALALRPVLYKAILITLAAAAAAGMLLYRVPLTYTDEWGNLNLRALEFLPRQSLATVPCAVGFVAIAALVSLNGCGYGAKTAYNVHRLRIKEPFFRLLWALSAAVCFLFYWAVLAVVFRYVMEIKGISYTQLPNYPHLWGPQSLLLAFYGSAFLHHLVPLQDAIIWGEDIVLLLFCSLSAVHFSMKQRQGRFSVLPIAAILMTAGSFYFPLESSSNLVLLPSAVALFAITLWSILEGDECRVEAPTV